MVRWPRAHWPLGAARARARATDALWPTPIERVPHTQKVHTLRARGRAHPLHGACWKRARPASGRSACGAHTHTGQRRPRAGPTALAHPTCWTRTRPTRRRRSRGAPPGTRLPDGQCPRGVPSEPRNQRRGALSRARAPTHPHACVHAAREIR